MYKNLDMSNFQLFVHVSKRFHMDKKLYTGFSGPLRIIMHCSNLSCPFPGPLRFIQTRLMWRCIRSIFAKTIH